MKIVNLLSGHTPTQLTVTQLCSFYVMPDFGTKSRCWLEITEHAFPMQVIRETVIHRMKTTLLIENVHILHSIECHTFICTHTYIHTHTFAKTHTHTHSFACICTHTHTHTLLHTCTHTHTHTDAQTATCTYTDKHSYVTCVLLVSPKHLLTSPLPLPNFTSRSHSIFKLGNE